MSTFNNTFQKAQVQQGIFFPVDSLVYLFAVELKACSVHPSEKFTAWLLQKLETP